MRVHSETRNKAWKPVEVSVSTAVLHHQYITDRKINCSLNIDKDPLSRKFSRCTSKPITYRVSVSQTAGQRLILNTHRVKANSNIYFPLSRELLRDSLDAKGSTMFPVAHWELVNCVSRLTKTTGEKSLITPCGVHHFIQCSKISTLNYSARGRMEVIQLVLLYWCNQYFLPKVPFGATR